MSTWKIYVRLCLERDGVALSSRGREIQLSQSAARQLERLCWHEELGLAMSDADFELALLRDEGRERVVQCEISWHAGLVVGEFLKQIERDREVRP